MFIGMNDTISNGVAAQPMRTRRPRIRSSRQIPKPAESCEQLDCGCDSECLQVIKNGKMRALCMKMKKNDKCELTPDDEEEEMTDSNSTTSVRLNLPDTCLERRCCEGETCVIQRTRKDSSMPIAVCTPVSVQVCWLSCLLYAVHLLPHFYCHTCMYY